MPRPTSRETAPEPPRLWRLWLWLTLLLGVATPALVRVRYRGWFGVALIGWGLVFAATWWQLGTDEAFVARSVHAHRIFRWWRLRRDRGLSGIEKLRRAAVQQSRFFRITAVLGGALIVWLGIAMLVSSRH